MRLTRLSDAIIRATITGVPAGATCTKVYLAIKQTDATADGAGLVVSATPSAGVATFNLTDVQTGTLSVRRYALSAKGILNDGRAIRLDLTDSDGQALTSVEVQPPGVDAVA